MTVTAGELVTLANDYKASREATVRRVAEVRSTPTAALFFTWKLKPTEERQKTRYKRQHRMFADDAAEPERKLRVDYAIVNDGFARRFCDHVPKDKSVPSEGPIFDASVTGEPKDGKGWLDLGSTSGKFKIQAIPIFTAEEMVGPNGGVSVAALLGPA
jgi:hypothetical protein